MPLKKLTLKAGVNRENTRYTNENGWYDCDKIRFRQGTPEKIGGWQRISSNTFLGLCRSLANWVTLSGRQLVSLGTNLKFYLESGGAYYDITPIQDQVTLTDPFQTTSGSSIVEVTDSGGTYIDGGFVSFYQATSVGGLTIYGTYQLTVGGGGSYTIDAGNNAVSTASGGGTVYATYQLDPGPAFSVPISGWGASTWGTGAWGIGGTSASGIRLWNEAPFGEDLIYGPRGGSIYYWDATIGIAPAPFTATVASPTVISTVAGLYDGTPLRFIPDEGSTLPDGIEPGKLYYVRNSTGGAFNISETAAGSLVAVIGAGSGTYSVLPNGYELAQHGLASDVPVVQNYLLVSDISRFVMVFGCNDLGATTLDPMLIRWSDQEDPFNWTPAATNQAGSLRLSTGSEIVTGIQARQEILVWTDTALYSLQYAGAPIVWSAQIMGDNLSIVSPNAVAYANGTAFWMGRDKFYKYDGRTQALRCDLRRFIFDDINTNQYEQVFAGTNEGFHEIWWFYCSANSDLIDKYVVYNYMEDIWYYGTMGRTAWLDSGLRNGPIAATYINNLVNHESGLDDNETEATLPITAYISSAEFDLDDGHQFMFVWRILPDLTFQNSTALVPTATMYLMPLKNSGSGYTGSSEPNGNHSVGGTSTADIVRTAVVPIEQFTGQVFTRVRGRQMAMKIESTGIGVTWQLGSPRLDMRTDGRR